MGFLTGLFGGEPSIWTIGFALIIVIVLIIIGVWLLKLIFHASGSMVRGRQKRLSLVDTMPIDNKHNLVLIRRDDVEHLIIISHSGDTVVETGIGAKPVANSTDKQIAHTPDASPPPKAPTVGAVAVPIAVVASTHSAKDTTSTTIKTTTERFNLARLLRRTPKETTMADDLAVEEAREPTTKSETAKAGPGLRHTGLLKPVSTMVGAYDPTEIPTNQDNSKPYSTDSAMNEAQQIDSRAMESIEEGANSVDDATKAKKSGGKSKSQKRDK